MPPVALALSLGMFLMFALLDTSAKYLVTSGLTAFFVVWCRFASQALVQFAPILFAIALKIGYRPAGQPGFARPANPQAVFVQFQVVRLDPGAAAEVTNGGWLHFYLTKGVIQIG